MCVFVGFSRIFLLGILIFKGLTARRVYKSFGVKGLNLETSKQDIIHTVKYADDCVLLDKEETVLQDMIDRLIEIGRCY
jgi:hypothetical protein